MRKIKSILLLTFCLAMLITSVNIPDDNLIMPTGHFENNTDRK